MEKDSGSLSICLGLPFSVWQAACDAQARHWDYRATEPGGYRKKSRKKKMVQTFAKISLARMRGMQYSMQYSVLKHIKPVGNI